MLTRYCNIFLDSTISSSKASTNYVPSYSTPTSSNETKSQSTSSNTIIPIDDKEKELPKSKEAPAPLIFEPPKTRENK